jgi:hypothetical protein
MESYIAQIKTSLRAVILEALCSGFSKTSYLVQDHVKYLKKIESAENPDRYIMFVSKKLFPNEEAFNSKIQAVRIKYQDTLASKFEELYRIYYEVSTKTNTLSWRQPISMPEAEDMLAKLLWD